MKINDITEASYEGNIGIMELMKFFKAAPPELVLKVKELMDKGANREVWQIVQKYTGTKLKGKEFEEAINEVIRKVKGGYRLYSKKGKNLGTYPSKSGAEKRERQVQYFKHNESLDEAFDQPYSISMKKKPDGGYFGVAKLDDGGALDIAIDLVDNGGPYDMFDIDFKRNGTFNTSGEGDAFRIFATVIAAIKQFLMLYRRNDSKDGGLPHNLEFTASKEQAHAPGGNATSRSKLYTRMVKKFASQMGYEAHVEDYDDVVTYELFRKR